MAYPKNRAPQALKPLPYMPQSKQATALARWLSELTYIGIRNVETPTLFRSITLSDGRSLRGVSLADDLCMTRQKTFFRIEGTNAIPMTNEEVVTRYDLPTLQQRFKRLKDEWKLSRTTN